MPEYFCFPCLHVNQVVLPENGYLKMFRGGGGAACSPLSPIGRTPMGVL